MIFHYQKHTVLNYYSGPNVIKIQTLQVPDIQGASNTSAIRVKAVLKAYNLLAYLSLHSR